MIDNNVMRKSITAPSIIIPMKKNMNILMNKSINNQKGLTMISWIVVLVFLLFQAVIAMNVIPVYISDSSVKKIMTELPHDVKATGASAKGLKSLISQRLSMNNVYSVKPENIKVKKGHGENIVTLEYEPRGKLIGNLEFIVNFKHEAKVKTR
jgi:hypothetical protein